MRFLKRDLIRAYRLGHGARGRTRVATAGLELRLRSRSARNPIRLDLRLGSRPAPYLLFDRAHLWNLDEIWLAEEYRPVADSHFDLILDLGANVGAATIWFN